MQLRNWLRRIRPNPLDKQLKKAQTRGCRSILILWNRGLGDIPLGLFALCRRIREFLPDAKITFLTRRDLEEGFRLLDHIQVLVDPHLQRGESIDLEKSLARFGAKPEDFDVILEKPDPTRWLSWQLGTLVPKLSWDIKWNAFARSFGLNGEYIGVHLQTETGEYYGYEKNWPLENWTKLLEELTKRYKKKILLFGIKPDPSVHLENVVDLRGKTSLFEMIAIIQDHCRILIVPDSGVLSILYYIEADFPIKIISLWADPRQGVLRQNVASPNPGLKHIPLIGKEEKIQNIALEDVLDAALQE
ncbi:MAG: hypothetical protein Tsb0015_17130 [Simkaniaceae bacterium]